MYNKVVAKQVFALAFVYSYTAQKMKFSRENFIYCAASVTKHDKKVKIRPKNDSDDETDVLTTIYGAVFDVTFFAKLGAL